MPIIIVRRRLDKLGRKLTQDGEKLWEVCGSGTMIDLPFISGKWLNLQRICSYPNMAFAVLSEDLDEIPFLEERGGELLFRRYRDGVVGSA